MGGRVSFRLAYGTGLRAEAEGKVRGANDNASAEQELFERCVQRELAGADLE